MPPLNTLAIFEAAGRRLNFSEAAQELGTTQPAISQQIGALEADLGVALFRRLHRGVALTVAGAELLAAVGAGLAAIEDAAATIRRSAGPKILQVLTDFGFAAWWLMPRLGTLNEQMPDVEVRVQTAQHEVDLRREQVDVAVLFGDAGQWPDCRVTMLFPEEVHPVCTPDFRARQDGFSGPGDLARLRLLHVRDAVPKRWLTWPDWFAAHGLEPGKRSQDMVFNNYQLVLQGALLGQGAALGWRPLIDDLLRGGHLELLDDAALRTARGYCLVEPMGRFDDPVVAQFRRWILDQRDTIQA
ncbi:MAG: LysR substrate-binding domain-containing protein [Aliidongia sp.]